MYMIKSRGKGINLNLLPQTVIQFSTFIRKIMHNIAVNYFLNDEITVS